ncbi:MAG: DUF6662 family protein [bacterium]
MTIFRRTTIVLTSVLAILAFSEAFANRRHFTYTYESAVLPKGSHELEIWNTIRLNRNIFYRANDTRSEFEFGLGGNLQTSLYLNLTSESTFLNSELNNSQAFGFSNEWKYRMLDHAIDPIGLALYAEGAYSNDEIELEGKIILDKEVDGFIFALNGSIEQSSITGVDGGNLKSQTETVSEICGGVAYLVAHNFTLGVEARQHIKHPPALEGGGSYSAFFAGPSLSFSGSNWWSAISVLPQIFGRSDQVANSDKFELSQHEKIEARLLLAFEF